MSAAVAAPVSRGREGSPLLRFVARRLLGAVAALFVASLVIFAGTQLLPGNAASVVLGRNGSPATVKKHLERVYVKLGVETRTAAAGIAMARLRQLNVSLAG